MKNSSFDTFIDEKFIPLSQKAKLGICLAVVLLLAILFYSLFFLPKTDQINSLKEEIKKLESDVKFASIKAENLGKFKKDVAKTEKHFMMLSALLPKEKEIPQLLRDISTLGRSAGLDFNTFKPETEKPKDFYKEIPITIKVRGPYHNMGYFFDQVSKMERIVSVTNVRMGSPEQGTGEMLLQSDCKLLTYQFSNEPLSKSKKKEQ